MGYAQKLINKKKRYLKAMKELEELKKNPKKQVITPLPKSNNKISKQEAFELIYLFNSKGMNIKEIQDGILILFDKSNSKNLERWEFEKLKSLASKVKNGFEYRKELEKFLWGED